jgi:hypothetical protein
VRNRLPNVKVAAVAPAAGEAPRCVISARAVCRDDKVYELPDGELGQFNVVPGGRPVQR